MEEAGTCCLTETVLPRALEISTLAPVLLTWTLVTARYLSPITNTYHYASLRQPAVLISRQNKPSRPNPLKRHHFN